MHMHVAANQASTLKRAAEERGHLFVARHSVTSSNGEGSRKRASRRGKGLCDAATSAATRGREK